MSDTTRAETAFILSRARLFWMALRFGLWTLLTLGLYRFWAKTRLRRVYWSAVRPGGVPLEYTGQGVEKLLGFLIAVVILSFYIGVVNLVLMFLSLSIFEQSATAYLLSFVGVIPLWFYARYRARRYVVGRTRWRGIRFGVDPGAWGYTWRALMHWAITILTLGLLWPRMTFWLEKYRADRTWYGTARIEQGGRWTMLLPFWLPLWSLALLPLTYVGYLGWIEVGGGIDWLDASGFADTVALMAGTAGAVLPVAVVFWSVASWKRLQNTKRADGLALDARPKCWRVGMIYGLGWLLVGIGMALAGAGVGLVTVGVIGDDLDAERMMSMPVALQIFLGVSYFLLLILFGALRHAFVTFPIWRHYASTLTVTGTETLHRIRQRARDEHTEAEGFAEALDLGAAI